MDIFEGIDFSVLNNARSLFYQLNGVARQYGLRAKTGTDTLTGEIYLLLSADRVFDRNACSKYGNGAIFSYKDNELKLKCLPSKLCFNYNKKNKPMNHQMFPIIDGTLINLYYWNGWRIGTKHSNDASNLEWRDVVYIEEFNRLLEKNPKFNLENLDINKTYSIIMASINMNPLSNIDDLFFVSSQNLTTGTYDYNNTIGIKTQKEIFGYEGQRFGVIYRSKDNGFDYIYRTYTYNKLKYILYTMPKDSRSPSVNNFIKAKFKNTYDMILVALLRGERDLQYRIPILAEKINRVQSDLDSIIQDMKDIFDNKKTELTDIQLKTRDFYKEHCKNGEDIEYYLKDLEAIVYIELLIEEKFYS